MISLFINRQQAVLDKDIEIDYYVYNPFFERKGDFTYDIDIDLRVPQNAQIYGHIIRHNNQVVQQKRRAELFCGGQCLISGTEVILSIEEGKAKIQIVSSNSELNYLAASDDATIQSLDMGSIAALDYTVAMNSLYGTSDTFDFVCTPVGKTFEYFPSEGGGNNWASNLFNALYRPDANRSGDFSLHFVEDTPLRAQPYLVTVVERVCQALGYTVTANVLRTVARWKNVAIVNTTDTLYFNKMVPDWKVNDFLTAVEEWCNVVFLNDRIKKEVKIVSVHDFYQNYSADTFIKSDCVIDGTDKVFNLDAVQNVSYDNVSYDLPGYDWYRYACFDEKLIASCQKLHYSSYQALTGAGIDMATEFDKKNIFVADDTGVHYVIRRRIFHDGSGSEGYNYFFYPVMTLQAVVDEHSEESTKFSIVPAICVMLYVGGVIYNIDAGRTQEIQMSASIPISLEETSSDKEIEIKGLNDYITGGMKEATVSSVMAVFQYLGVQSCFSLGSYTAEHYPQTLAASVWPQVGVVPYMENCYIYNYYEGRFQYSMHQIMPENRSLAPKALYDAVYSLNQKIDTSRTYKINFLTSTIYDAKNYFFIRNLKLYCNFLHYRINIHGLRKTVEGEFYPVK